METFEDLNKCVLDIEPGMEDFLPEEFKSDPIAYFRKEGINIKSGVRTFKEDGTISEDPDAVKDLPIWRNSRGEELHTVGKLINAQKSQIGKSGNPFYEYEIMKLVKGLNMPCADLVAKVEQSGEYLFLMKKIPGLRWVDSDIKFLKDQGLIESDLKNLERQAWQMTEELGQRFTDAGIIRTWKPKDMIFEIDIKNKRITKITPVDWERTKIEQR